jgi:outer membrane cobalamin receptor
MRQTLIVLALILGAPVSVFADETSDSSVAKPSEVLDLSVTATRVEAPAGQVPRSIKILKHKDLVEKEQAASVCKRPQGARDRPLFVGSRALGIYF